MSAGGGSSRSSRPLSLELLLAGGGLVEFAPAADGVFEVSTCFSKQASRSSGVVSFTHSLTSTLTASAEPCAAAGCMAAAAARTAAIAAVRNPRFVLVIVVTTAPQPVLRMGSIAQRGPVSVRVISGDRRFLL